MLPNLTDAATGPTNSIICASSPTHQQPTTAIRADHRFDQLLIHPEVLWSILVIRPQCKPPQSKFMFLPQAEPLGGVFTQCHIPFQPLTPRDQLTSPLASLAA